MKQPQLEAALREAWPPADWRDITALVAVSGGPDSVTLLRAMAAAKRQVGGSGRLIVAHFNHHLRPEADDDAAFVAELARRLELPVERGQANVAELANQQGDGIEAAARDARYTFLRQTAERLGARYIATGHTADDQVETVLFNILRGTGLSGLAGIPRARPLGPAVSLIRPLLNVRRTQVMDYLAEIAQPFLTDPSNASRDFARNRLRHELLPLLRERFNSEVDTSITRLSRLAGEAQRLIEGLAEELLERCASPRVAGTIVAMVRGLSGATVLNTALLIGVDRHLVREMFVAFWRRSDWPAQNMGFDEWDFLAEMALAAPGETTMSLKRTLPGGIRAERIENQILLARQSA